METNYIIKNERQYYIDWLRILLILSVFLFHIGMIYNTWPWHIKNETQYKGILWYTMVFLGYWRMPLLFLISGAGTYFALGKRTSGQYLGERFKRLFIPLIVGIFTLVPVQIYIERSTQYDSLISFYPHMFEGIYPTGNFSWHHLWYIAYLFFISLFISPFLGFLRGKRFSNFTKSIESFLGKPLSLNVFVIILILSQLILRPFFKENTHDLIHDWAAITYYIIFFLAGFILLPNKTISAAICKNRYWYLAEGIIATILMFNIPNLLDSEKMIDAIWDVVSIFVAWSFGITAIGFAKQYLNKDSKLRKYMSEAIYPFYLLHQPVIIIVGFIVLKYNLPLLWEVLFIIIGSLTITVTVYWFFIRPYNITRVIFGMKRTNKQEYCSMSIDQFESIQVQTK